MTYEEYKNKRSSVDKKSSKIIGNILNKLFTIIIFTMLVVIISNYSVSFRKFIIDKVLNNTMDFSKMNNIVDEITGIFKFNETKSVSNIISNKSEKYLDGIKYIVGQNENVYVKDSGIVTYIGNKDGYNNTIIVQQSNGYYAWYGNVSEKVKLYDYIESGTIIGTASNEYYYVLLNNDKIVDLFNEN